MIEVLYLSAEQLATYIESHQHRLNEICLGGEIGS